MQLQWCAQMVMGEGVFQGAGGKRTPRFDELLTIVTATR